ncbi:MAG: ClpXP protease specificity-enhancing factor SspB [Jannaschia sp.]
MADARDTIDYGSLMHEAMRGLIAEVLRDVAQNGLPGDHHFFIAFDTNHRGVTLAGWLHERYPEEMTIVLQHEILSLEVGTDQFSITLSFGDRPEALVVPFDAMRSFVDPSVEFGLRFEARETGPVEALETDEDEAPFADIAEDAAPPARRGDAEIVSLDKFRK